MPVGTTTVENLLRVARSEAAAGTAFAALHAGGASRIVSVPAGGSADSLSSGELVELVRQAAADPEFLQARVFVRTVRMSRPLTLAVAPLHKTSSGDMIGLVAEHDRKFEAMQLDVLERLAERLVRHLEVVQHLNTKGAREGGGAVLEQGGEPETGEWDGEWLTGESVRGDVWSGAVVSVASPSVAALPAVEPTSPAPRPTAAASRPPAAAFPQPAPWPAPEPLPPSTAPAMGGWAEPDPLTGLPSLGQFFSRAGRLLPHGGRPDAAPDGRAAGAFALVVVEVPEERTTAVAAGALTKELRFGDPVARIDRRLLAAALVIVPSRTGDAVEARLAEAVRSALDHHAGVRSAHAMAEPGDRRDVDELLREAVSRLQGR